MVYILNMESCHQSLVFMLFISMMNLSILVKQIA